MGNVPSICGVDGGVIVNDNGVITCYTMSRIVNVSNLQSVQSSNNTSIQAFTELNGEGTLVPLSAIGYNNESIQSIVITIHWTRQSIILTIFAVILVTLLFGYSLWHGHKHYKKLIGMPTMVYSSEPEYEYKTPEEPIVSITLNEEYNAPVEDQIIKNLRQADEQYTAPPIEEYTAPPVEEYTAPPIEEYTAPPVEEYTAPPTEEYTAPPVEEYTAPPTEEYTAPPVEEYTAPPTEEYTAPPTEEYTAPPTEEYIAPQAVSYTEELPLSDNTEDVNLSESISNNEDEGNDYTLSESISNNEDEGDVNENYESDTNEGDEGDTNESNEGEGEESDEKYGGYNLYGGQYRENDNSSGYFSIKY